MPDSIDYRSPPTENPRARRSFRRWILLLVIWSTGLIVWLLYFAAAVYVMYRIF